MKGSMHFLNKMKLFLLLAALVTISRSDISEGDEDGDGLAALWDWSRHDLFEEDEHAQEHIKEDLKKVGVDDTSNMTAEEINMHYFKLHDYDENEKLDGIEILQSFMHTYFEHDVYKSKTDEERQQLLDFYINAVDELLEKNDRDQDGYLNYFEYKLAQNQESKIAG